MPDSDSRYKVGPGRPPLHIRFKKGQSGNRGGRSAKGLPGLLAAPLDEPIFVTIDGRAASSPSARPSSPRWSTNPRAQICARPR
jgi:hypothetical protein